MTGSLEIGPHNLEQSLDCLLVQRAWMKFFVDQMCSNVVFDDLGHEAGHSTANGSDDVQDRFTLSLALDSTLNRINLTTNAADSGEQFLLALSCMTHGCENSIPRYPIRSRSTPWHNRKVGESYSVAFRPALVGVSNFISSPRQQPYASSV